MIRGNRFSIRSALITMVVVAIGLTAIGNYFRVLSSRPNLYCCLVIEFTQPYGPPTEEDLISMLQRSDIGQKRIKDISDRLIDNRLGLLTDSDTTFTVSSTGKSWREEQTQIDDAAHQLAELLEDDASTVGAVCSVIVESTFELRHGIPKQIFAEMDRTKH